MVCIHIEKLTIPVILGTKPRERTKKQKIVLDLFFEYQACKAINCDDLNHAIDYELLAKTIIKEVSRTQFFLLEKLADFILDIVMKNPKIKKAHVLIHKPHAIKGAQGVTIELSRKNRADQA